MTSRCLIPRAGDRGRIFFGFLVRALSNGATFTTSTLIPDTHTVRYSDVRYSDGYCNFYPFAVLSTWKFLLTSVGFPIFISAGSLLFLSSSLDRRPPTAKIFLILENVEDILVQSLFSTFFVFCYHWQQLKSFDLEKKLWPYHS